jgi:alpha-L-fucosidase 2
MRTLLLLLLPSLLIAQPKAQHNLIFSEIPVKWHEGLPHGNGLLGSIVWQKDGKLRLALDRSDLWDSRPMNGLDRPEFTYQWVAQQVAKKEYSLVQEYFDAPYEREAGPTKLPGGALEFDIENWKTAGPGSVQLDISTGLSTIQWIGGQRFETFIHANKEEGWFRCTGFSAPAACLKLLPPQYSSPRESKDANSVQGSDLARLGYPQSEAFMHSGIWVFHQPGWGGFSYDIAVSTRQVNDNLWEGVWSISCHFPGKRSVNRAETTVKKALRRGF